MAEEVYRIEIPIQTVDNTEPALTQIQNKINEFERSVDKVNKTKLQPDVQTAQAQSTISKFESSMKRSEEQINRMNRTKLQLIASAIDKASGVLGYIGSKAKALVSKTYRITVSVIDNVTKPFRAIGNFLTSTIGMITAGAGVAGGIVIPMTISGNFEQTQIAFETMLKSGDKANKFLEEAEDFANKTPFEFPELIQSSKLLKAFGFEIERVLPMMTTIGDTSSGLGAGSEGIERITRALGQMKAKGRLQAEELLQLQELGVPAAQILQEELGLTAEQVANIGNAGVEASKGIDALLRGMDKRFGGMMDKQSKTAFGMISTVMDTIKNKFLRRWGAGLWDGLKPELEKVTGWLDKNQDKVKEWSEGFRKVGMEISTWVAGKLDAVYRNIKNLVSSSEWKEAKTLGQKMRLAWDKVISEPFEEWWNGPGKAKITSIAQSIGRGLGGTLGGFISAALGIAADPDKVGNESPFIQAGATAGKAFLDAFLQAFDASKLAEKAGNAFVNTQKEVGKFAPGGEKPGTGSYLGLALDAFLLYKGIKGGKGIVKGAKGVGKAYSGIKNFFTGSTGAAAAGAAAEGATEAAAAVKNTGAFTRFKGLFSGKASKAGKTVAETVADAPAAKFTSGYKAADASFWNSADLSKVESRANIVELSNAGKLGRYSELTEAFGGPKAPGAMSKIGGFFSKMNPLKAAGEAGETAGLLSKLGKVGKVGKVVKGVPILGTALSLLGSGAAIAAAPEQERGRTAAGEVGGTLGGLAGGAAAGAAIGAAFGGVGAVPGAIVGGIIGAFGGDAIGKWIYDQKDAIGKFFSDIGTNVADFVTSIPGKFSSLVDSVGQWFQKTVDNAVSFLSTLPSRAAEQIGFVIGYGVEKASQLPGAIATWFQTTVDNAVTFFQELPGRISNTVASIVETASENAAAFIAQFSAWFSQARDEAISFISGIPDMVVSFITSIPEKLAQAGQAVIDAFKTLGANIVDGLVGGFNNAVVSIGSAASWIVDKVKGGVEAAKNFGASVAGSMQSGYEKGREAAKEHAFGGIMTSPHLGLVAEAGPEAIIPLSGSKRSRGVDLWRQAGAILGLGGGPVLAYADGGIAGYDSEDNGGFPVMAAPGGRVNSGTSFKIEVTSSPVYQINTAADEEAVLAVIRSNQQELADEFSDEIAENLKGIFQNMPGKG